MDVLMGEFNLKSNNMILTDPFIDYAMVGQAHVKNALKGKWKTYIKKKKLPGLFGKTKVFALVVVHESVKSIKKVTQSPEWEDLDGEVLVEEEIAGIFDKEYFDQKRTQEIDGLCDFDKYGSVFSAGTVCFAGFGNGCYPAFALYDENDNIFAVKIEFIEEK